MYLFISANVITRHQLILSDSVMSSHNLDKFSRIPGEEVWVERQPFLLSRGYRLRPRYDPDWVPSWKLPRKKPIQYISECEDALRTGLEFSGRIMDAVRIHDGPGSSSRKSLLGKKRSQLRCTCHRRPCGRILGTALCRYWTFYSSQTPTSWL